MKYVYFLVVGLVALTTVLMIPIAVVVQGYVAARAWVEVNVDRVLEGESE
jgi:hypothetical protein